jgi:sodium pump decarboxylase gamma subunit
MEIQSASLNEESTMGDAMVKAALNTIIGIGTVFIVLILISFIIALFGFIPKIQAKIEEGKKKKEDKVESIDNTIAQIAAKEEVDVTDDYELVAVIAAAIAASEGAASTDGFVVRSVRKVNRRR